MYTTETKPLSIIYGKRTIQEYLRSKHDPKSVAKLYLLEGMKGDYHKKVIPLR